MHETVQYFDCTKYKQARPKYPQKLYETISEHLNYLPVKRILDVGCGSGQASFDLLKYGKHVLGIDPSPIQIQGAKEEATKRQINPDRIEFKIGDSDAIPVDDHSIDLVTVAQAIHWFHTRKFYEEVKRVLVPSGSIAIWCYDMARILNNEVVENTFLKLHSEILEKYWTEHRKMVNNGYKELDLPFKHIKRLQIPMEYTLNINEFLAYIDTWSSVYEYKKAHPNEDCCAELKKVLDTCNSDTVFQLQSTIHVLLASD